MEGGGGRDSCQAHGQRFPPSPLSRLPPGNFVVCFIPIIDGWPGSGISKNTSIVHRLRSAGPSRAACLMAKWWVRSFIVV